MSVCPILFPFVSSALRGMVCSRPEWKATNNPQLPDHSNRKPQALACKVLAKEADVLEPHVGAGNHSGSFRVFLLC